ncbi:M50 family metallopeptidase [Solibacillus sp. FSL H8-0538]|uniref:M50 family metallopeptidase n=1 Tax=Solibacillus sp. FSL H8-0538 TaxID=2921400 RepID=UPI0030F8ECC8
MILGYLVLASVTVFIDEILHYYKRSSKLLSFFSSIIQLSYTLVHEFSHAITTVLTRGKVLEMKLHYNLSGHVRSSSNNWFSRVLVTYSGYTLPCLISIFFFNLMYLENFQWIIISYMIMSFISLIFIRNLYGFCWIIGFIGLLGWILYFNNPIIITHTAIFLSSILLISAVYSGFRILLFTFKFPGEDNDATSLSKNTWIPAKIWSFLFLIQSVLTGIISALIFL